MFTDEIIETEVLVIGGGPAGCLAAIKASEAGARVMLFEKGAISRSGNSNTGLHRIPLIHPDYNYPFEEFVKVTGKEATGITNDDLNYAWAKDSYEHILELEKWGLKVRRDDGSFVWGTSLGIAYPGKVVIYPPEPRVWQNTKPVIAEQVRRHGVDVAERTMATSLLTQDRHVVGATGLNNRTGSFLVCKAKAVFLGTGGAYRLYRHEDTSYAPSAFITVMSPNAGDGLSMAYRAGAEILNMEFTALEFMWKDYNQCGCGPIMGLEAPLVDGKGNLIVPPGPVEDGRIDLMRMVLAEGKGPFFFDLTRLPEDRIKQIEQMLENERAAYFTYLRQREINLRKAPVEFEFKPQILHWCTAGINIDTNGKTSIDGLYAGGDTAGGLKMPSFMGALAIGARAGKAMAQQATKVAEFGINKTQVDEERTRISTPLQRRDGYTWVELEDKIRRIVSDYAGFMRSEAKLERGIERLQTIKTKYLPQIFAKDAHELMRALEVQYIMDVAEMHMKAALFRKETRNLFPPFHYRTDYPNKDDKNWRKHTVIKMEDGQMKLGTMEPRRME